MRQVFGWVAAVSVVVGVTGAALAQRPAPESPPASTGAVPGAPAPAAPAGGELRDRTTVSGEVTSIDTARGTVRVRTPRGQVEMLLAPAVLEGVQLGDRLDVELAVRPARASVPGPRPGVPPTTPGVPIGGVGTGSTDSR